MIKEDIFLGTSGTIVWLLKSKEPDGQGFLATDLSAVTRMVLRFDGSQTVDSAVSVAAFDWTTVNFTGELILNLGAESVTVGEYENVRLIVYDPTNPLGLVWDANIYMKVFAA